VDEGVPPPATFAFSWLSGPLLYRTPSDDGRASWDTWVLTHPDLRLSTALSAGVGVDEVRAREIVQDGETIEHQQSFAYARAAPGSGEVSHGKCEVAPPNCVIPDTNYYRLTRSRRTSP
jgi:hypothetical protein